MERMNCIHILFCVFLLGLTANVNAWGDKDKKVLLKDVSTLTLHSGRETTGRRSRPIPQVRCVGGTAGCNEFVPQVVQCYNRGSNGYDIQWECKTDMDNAYRFGQVTVACEGYDYPDDPYILQGSCGLEYTLDLTKEGLNSRKSGSHEYYGQSHQKDKYYKDSTSYPSKEGSGLKDLIVLAVVCIIIYGIYKTCIASQTNGAEFGDSGPGPDTYPQRPSWFGSFFGGGRGGGTGYNGAGAPPPYGFRSEFGTDSCGGGAPRGSSSGAGSFWTGAATGGILGYMMGNRGNTGYRTAYSRPSHGDSWGGTSSFAGGASSSSSSGTRTASGFGETRRR